MNLATLEKKIKKLLKKDLNEEIIKEMRFFLIKEKDLGDYSTNLLFLLQKKYSPEKINQIIEKIKNHFYQNFSSIEIVNNYLNFKLSDYALAKILRQKYKTIFSKKNFSFLKKNKSRSFKINIDYVSANPTGPLTLANARGAVLGDALANIFKLYGHKVTKEYYVNDRGTQIELLGKTILAHWGKISFEDNFYQGDYLREIADKLKNKISLDKPQKIGKIVSDYILKNYIKPTLRKFGTFHDFFFFESELYQKGLKEKILKKLKRENMLEEREGAVYLLLTKLGEEKDEVLIRNNGEPTYFFSDLLYHYYKFFIRKFKIVILIVGADHLNEVRRLKQALKIFKIRNYQFQYILMQFVHLKKGEEQLKMSKRKGVFITLDELINLVKADIVRFFFLQKSPEITVEFDLSLAQKQSEENPYWYVQYAHARLCSVLEKAKKMKLSWLKVDPQKIAFDLLKIEEAKEIIRDIAKFEDVINIANKDYRVNILIEYIIGLCKKIHSFYEKEKIIPDKSKLAFTDFLISFLRFYFLILGIKPIKRI